MVIFLALPKDFRICSVESLLTTPISLFAFIFENSELLFSCLHSLSLPRVYSRHSSWVLDSVAYSTSTMFYSTESESHSYSPGWIERCGANKTNTVLCDKRHALSTIW